MRFLARCRTQGRRSARPSGKRSGGRSSRIQDEVHSVHLPYVALPDEINLSNPAMTKQWYETVSFTIKDSNGRDQVVHTQPMVLYAAVLKDAQDGVEQGQKFVSFMQSAEGQKLFKAFGHAEPKGDSLYAR